MFYYLSEYTQWFSPLRVFQYVTFRAVFAALTALLMCVLVGPWLIRRLVEMKFQQPIRGEDDLRELAKTHGKKACPTMGGILIIWAVVDSTLLWARPTNQLVLICLVTLIWLGGIGFLDDWAKVQEKKVQRDAGEDEVSLSNRAGIVCGDLAADRSAARSDREEIDGAVHEGTGDRGHGMVGIAAGGGGDRRGVERGEPDGRPRRSGDGMHPDGGADVRRDVLRGRQFPIRQLPAGAVRVGAGELTVVCAALIGASLGFLWFNCHPAQVFMGDTGSLAIGGLIGAIAVMIKQELVLVIVGGIFVMEAASVILQVASFKLRGKRIFAMAPLHHHFELRGWSETKVTTRFWVLSVIFALLGLATLKLR
jgi:phospho-N-acetylmuramoyl-pentapeptide-transferase